MSLNIFQLLQSRPHINSMMVDWAALHVIWGHKPQRWSSFTPYCDFISNFIPHVNKSISTLNNQTEEGCIFHIRNQFDALHFDPLHWQKHHLLVLGLTCSLLLNSEACQYKGTIMRRAWDTETRWGEGTRGRWRDGNDGGGLQHHELRVGSLGSCAPEECCGGWWAFFYRPGPCYQYTNRNLSPWFTITKG